MYSIARRFRALGRCVMCSGVRQLGGARHASSETRSYSEALNKLSQLQSNRSTTKLFESPAPLDSPGNHAPPQDLNAAALPEMRAWLQRAGYSPEKDLCKMRHIHVAGTKGKGSVCAYATAILAKHRRVGTYTSPHLVSPRERISINGEPVSQELFASAFFEIWDRLTEAARLEGRTDAEAEGPASKPFFFRFLTIMAWHIFLTQGIKDVVMECGIGGEYDATNVLPAEAVSVAVVTQLGIDHVAMLGHTVEKIAWHKAGIFKTGTKALTRRLDDQPDVMKVLRARAQERGANLIEVADVEVDKWGGVGSHAAPGDFRKKNQALAVLAAMEHLNLPKTTLSNIPSDMAESLREAKLRGRGEVIIDGNTKWCLDGAHTKDSLDEVAKWFIYDLRSDESVILIFNQQDRDVSALLESFIDAVSCITDRQDIFSHAIFTTNDTESITVEVERDLTIQRKAAETMERLIPSCQTIVYNNVRGTVLEARTLAHQPGTKRKVLVTGSMHLVGAIMKALEPWSLY